jgi:hypothetical protein
MIHTLSHLALQPGLDGHFESYETLQLPYPRLALHFLRRFAYIVGPIMARRGWTVPLLSELPPSSSCYGICHTRTYYTRNRFGITSKARVPLRIELRLRTRTGFAHPYCVVRTLLHELAHLEYGHHFVGFYRFNQVLLDELVRVVESNEGERDVGFREVPGAIADTKEIVGTIMGDLKTCFKGLLGVDQKGIEDKNRIGT